MCWWAECRACCMVGFGVQPQPLQVKKPQTEQQRKLQNASPYKLWYRPQLHYYSLKFLYLTFNSLLAGTSKPLNPKLNPHFRTFAQSLLPSIEPLLEDGLSSSRGQDLLFHQARLCTRNVLPASMTFFSLRDWAPDKLTWNVRIWREVAKIWGGC